MSAFISYARADDEPFAKRLAQDLPDIWWDRTAMENRGRTFLQEIRDAIAESDRLILIVGPKSLTSDYVTAEWRFAYQTCIPIVPVLRVSDYSDLPEELEHAHTVEAREDRQSYDDAVTELRRILSTPVDPLGALHGVDALPTHHVPRLTEMSSLAELVLEDTQQTSVVTPGEQMTALWGMGGSGKSVLAAAFARACGTRRAFPGGIVWLCLGQHPNLALVFAAAGRALGDQDAKAYLDEQGGAARLVELMRVHNVLLVIDDAWDMEHVVPFRNALSVNLRCRLLITTRDGSLATALGVRRHEISELSDVQARTLLARWADLDPQLLPREANDIIKECGNLPLALAIIGAMLRGRPDRWANALHKLRQADLERIQRVFANYPYPSLLRSIQVSVDALEPEARARYLDLAIIPDETPAPPSVLQRLWGLERFETEDMVDNLVDRSLARIDESGALTLHDLQRDYVCHESEDLASVHQRLLDAYGATIQSWERGPNDGYYFENLAHHLIGAKHRDELIQLLVSSPEWLQAKFAACQEDGPFLADLERVLTTDSLTLAEFVELRCLKQVVKERTSLYTDVDLETLVHLGRTEEARAHACLRDSELERFGGLRLIYDSVDDPAEFLDALYDAAKALRDDGHRMWALCDLASRLYKAGDGRLDGVLKEAWSLADACVVPGEQADMYRRLAAVLVEAGRADEAIALVRSISHFWSFAPAMYEMSRILERRGGHRAAAVLEEAREQASSMRVDLSDPHEIGELAATLARSGCIDKTRKMIARLPKQAYKEKREALGALASAFADQGRFEEAIDAARTADGLDLFADHTTEVVEMLIEAGRLDEAESEACRLRRRAVRVLTKVAVARAANHEKAKADALFERATRMARTPADERGYDLHDLAKGLLEAGRLEEAEATVRDIAAPWKRSEALSDLALALARSGDARAGFVLDEARQTARSTERTGPRSDAIASLAMFFVGAGEYARARELARWIPIADPRARVFRDLAVAMQSAGDPHVNEVIEEAHAAAQAIDSSLDYGLVKVRELGELALAVSRFDGKRGGEILSEARKMARTIGYASSRVNALGALARLVADVSVEQAADILEEACSVTETTTDHQRDLAGVASQFAELGMPDRAAEIARDLEHMSWKQRVLSAEALARASLGDPAADAVFEAAYDIASTREKDDRYFALGELVEPLVEAKRLDFAERVVREILEQEDLTRGETDLVSALISALVEDGWLEQGLTLARALTNCGGGNQGLLAASMALTKTNQPGAKAILTEAWQVARGKYEYAPFKARLLLGVASGLAEVNDPRLGDALGEARDEVRAVETDCHERSGLFRELAEIEANAGYDGADAVFEEAIAAARAYDHEASRADFLEKLADALAQRGHLRRALDACQFQSLDSMIEKLTTWIPYTQESLEVISAVLSETLRIAGWVRAYWLEIRPLVEHAVTE
jgi:hypothetical protein